MIEDLLEKNSLFEFKNEELDFLTKLIDDFTSIFMYRYFITNSHSLTFDEIPENLLKDCKLKYDAYIQILRRNRKVYILNFCNIMGKLDKSDAYMFNILADAILREN